MRSPRNATFVCLAPLWLAVAACDGTGGDAAAPLPTDDPSHPMGTSNSALQTQPAQAGSGAKSQAQRANNTTSAAAMQAGQAGSAAPATSADMPVAMLQPGTGAAGMNAASPAAMSGSTGTAGAAGPAAMGSAGALAAAGAAALPAPPTPAPLRWTPCDNLQCAELEVPLDYANPSGEQIKLAVTRRSARGQRIGSLLINPGGPGGSAVEFLPSFLQVAGSALLQRFDIVAFDPRGVGQSTPLDCHSTLQRLVAVDPTPDSDAEWSASDAAAKTFADECAQKHGKLLPHLGTPNVARDMDQLRAALGEEKLNYLGFSYGTAIGAQYAELFPQRVRALVLDGALDMSLSAVEISLEQAVGFERSLSTYFEWCARSAGNCSWVTNGTPAEAFKALTAQVDAQPLMARDGDRSVGPGEMLYGVIAPLYGGEDGYRVLSSALSGAARGDGSTLLSLTDNYLSRNPDGSYGNLQEANSAVNCLDAPAPDYAALKAEATRFSAASPTFGLATLTSLFVCAHWPVQSVRGPVPRAAGAAPILVVGTTGDPATPYAWAQALSKELESGVLLTYEGEGHTAYGRGVPCIDAAVEAYLVDGKVPAANTRCGGASALVPRMPQVQSARGARSLPQQFVNPALD